jgi:hypothetical protein
VFIFVKIILVAVNSITRCNSKNAAERASRPGIQAPELHGVILRILKKKYPDLSFTPQNYTV